MICFSFYWASLKSNFYIVLVYFHYFTGFTIGFSLYSQQNMSSFPLQNRIVEMRSIEERTFAFHSNHPQHFLISICLGLLIKFSSMSDNKNLCIIAIGMSGTGKTTFVKKFSETNLNTFCINLDPAVMVLPYDPIIDIREQYHYKKVMKDHKLGPNGAILTALNLFTSQPEHIIKGIKQVMNKSSNENNIFVVDIPGQIEVFTWSSSSIILTQAISTLMPVKIVYIIDSVRCQNPNIFLSNLLFAQSIQYRLAKYPFTILLNKSDCSDSGKLINWSSDYELFLGALNEDSSYQATLSKSIVINLSEFYEKLKYLPISAKTGQGIEEVTNHLLQ